MANKTNNTTNYDILDKILAESDKNGRGGGNGKGKFEPFQDANGNWVYTEEQASELFGSVNEIEKYLRNEIEKYLRS